MGHASDTSLSPEPGGLFHLDALIGHWNCWEEHENFYLSELLPSLMRDPSCGDDFERGLLTTLKSRLTKEEWIKLPDAVARRRKREFTGFAIDRSLAEERRILSVYNNLRALIEARAWESFETRFVAVNLPESTRQEIQELREREKREEQREQEAVIASI